MTFLLRLIYIGNLGYWIPLWQSFLFIPYSILCYLVFIFFSINTIEKFHILIILLYQTIHTIEIYEPQSLNHHSHIGIFNFTNVFGLSVRYLLSMYNRYRGFESLNVPQVFAFQDLSLFISVLHLVIYNTSYTPLLKCSRISPTQDRRVGVVSLLILHLSGLLLLNRMYLEFASLYNSCIVLCVSTVGFPTPPNNTRQIIGRQVTSSFFSCVDVLPSFPAI